MVFYGHISMFNPRTDQSSPSKQYMWYHKQWKWQWRIHWVYLGLKEAIACLMIKLFIKCVKILLHLIQFNTYLIIWKTNAYIVGPFITFCGFVLREIQSVTFEKMRSYWENVLCENKWPHLNICEFNLYHTQDMTMKSKRNYSPNGSDAK